MKKKTIIITVAVAAALCLAGCGGKKQDLSTESSEEQSVAETTVEETETSQETEESAPSDTEVTETSEEVHGEIENPGQVPQPGDIFNGHTVDHTEDQPDCDDGSHGTIWIFYTDIDDIDYYVY